MKYGKFDANTGKMVSIIDTPVEITYQLSDYLLAEIPDKGPYYFDFANDQPVKCTDMPVTITGTTINVSPGTQFRVSAPHVTGDDGGSGVLEFDFSDPGDYEVTLFHVKHLTKEVTLNAS